MNLPDSFSSKIMIFLGCCSLSNDTATVSSAFTSVKVSWLAQGSPVSLGKSTVCVRATVISSSYVIVGSRLHWFLPLSHLARQFFPLQQHARDQAKACRANRKTCDCTAGDQPGNRPPLRQPGIPVSKPC